MDIQRLLDLTEKILILRGGSTSGNWGHAGRKGKRGGSGKGGGFKRVGVKPGVSRKAVKQAAKQAAKKASDSGITQKETVLSLQKPKLKSVKRGLAKPTNHKEMSKSYDSWHKGMTERENDGLITYQTSNYLQINGHLRGGKKISEENQEAIKNIDKALSKATVPRDVTVYRGIEVETLSDLLGSDQPGWVGQTIEDKAYISTTVNKKRTFPGVSMEIRVPKGSKGGYLGNLPGGVHNNEQELLLGRGQKLLIKKVESGGLFGNQGIKKIIAEIVED